MENGAKRGRPKIVELETTSGVIVHVTPLMGKVHLMLQQRAREQFPDPDPTPYVEDIPNAAVPGLTTDPEDNEDYRVLMADINQQRSDFITEFVFQQAVTYPEGEATLIEQFHPLMEGLAKLDPSINPDSFQDVRDYAILNNEEKLAIMIAAQDQLPVTEVELDAAYRLFRLSIPWATFRQMVRGRAPGVPGRPKSEQQPSGRRGQIGDGDGVDDGTVVQPAEG